MLLIYVMDYLTALFQIRFHFLQKLVRLLGQLLNQAAMPITLLHTIRESIAKYDTLSLGYNVSDFLLLMAPHFMEQFRTIQENLQRHFVSLGSSRQSSYLLYNLRKASHLLL